MTCPAKTCNAKWNKCCLSCYVALNCGKACSDDPDYCAESSDDE